MLRFSMILSAITLGVALLRKFRYPSNVPASQGPMTDAEVDEFLIAAADNVRDAPDWRNSIVDLAKILRLDSSKGGRAELWMEMGHIDRYVGSAEQNIQLHADVMLRIKNRDPITP